MNISVIIPAYNSPHELRECLTALRASSRPPDEIVVVDDGSTDDTAEIAAAASVRVLRGGENRGAAAARNLGAEHACGDVLFFIDADVAVAPDAVDRVARLFAAEPDVAAVFGSYDAQPRARGVVSEYRNLLHHYVHQRGSTEAFSFWTGCGAVRRAAFTAIAGFDEHPAWRSIEDIELGYRLRRAGYRIRLDKELRGTHLKHWTLAMILRTDLLFRAAPWARLIRHSDAAPADLNLAVTQRLSVALVGIAMVALPLAFLSRAFAVVAALALAGVLALNCALYGFFYRERGLAFALACLPLHALYFLCSGAGFVYGWLTPPRNR
ncbi:MAG: glycosyltransferase family 2 protein [Deltaproteobacteria bacterium]|nr:glycosyltransferase family 2 protein [Deltaproteobacteria bacterium]